MKKLALFLACSASLWTSLAQSAPIYSTEQFLFGFDAIFNADNIIAPVTTTGSSPTSSSIGSSVNFSGLNESNNSATSTLSYASSTESSSGGTLKSSSVLGLTNGFFNSGNAISEGPAQIGMISRSIFSDDITLVGTGLSRLRVDLQVDGMLTSNQPGSYVSPAVQVGDGTGSIWSYGFLSSETVPASLDLVISAFFPVVADAASIYLDLETELAILPRLYSADGISIPSYIETESNFFNTLTITELAGLDALDNPVDLIRATGSDGFQFQTVRVDQPPSAVPAPSTLALFALGGLFIFFRRMRFS